MKIRLSLGRPHRVGRREEGRTAGEGAPTSLVGRSRDSAARRAVGAHVGLCSPIRHACNMGQTKEVRYLSFRFPFYSTTMLREICTDPFHAMLKRARAPGQQVARDFRQPRHIQFSTS